MQPRPLCGLTTTNMAAGYGENIEMEERMPSPSVWATRPRPLPERRGLP